VRQFPVAANFHPIGFLLADIVGGIFICINGIIYTVD